MKKTLEERFWPKVQKTDTCWLWTGGNLSDGYGRIYTYFRDKKPVLELAHRVAWQLTNGPIPEGIDVLHRCDNPSCVRPDHLFLGTLLDNAVDRENKGRGGGKKIQGENHYKVELSQKDVRSIVDLLASGNGVREISRQFGINSGTITCIKNGRSWRGIVTDADLERIRIGYKRSTRIPHHELKTYCSRGHLLSGDNLIVNADGHRRCRICENEGQRRRHQHKEAVR
jgi:hypothetical protein